MELTNEQAAALHRAALKINSTVTDVACASGSGSVLLIVLKQTADRLREALELVDTVRAELEARGEHFVWRTDAPEAGRWIVGADRRKVWIENEGHAAQRRMAARRVPDVFKWRYLTDDEIAAMEGER